MKSEPDTRAKRNVFVLVLAQALFQDEGILCANCHYKGQAHGEAGDHSIHMASTLRPFPFSCSAA